MTAHALTVALLLSPWVALFLIGLRAGRPELARTSTPRLIAAQKRLAAPPARKLLTHTH